MLALSPESVSVVIAPEEDVLVSKFPVEIVSTVPEGLVFKSKLTVADVLYITKLNSTGGTDKV